MRFLSEAQSAELVSHELAYTAVRSALIVAATTTASTFPALIAHGADDRDFFAVKAASAPEFVGVKIGSYWPGNTAVPRHGTVIVLLDPDTGRAAAVVEASAVNAYRTAAADAVAADALARPDARTLTIFGTGHQAFFECEALSRVRPIEVVNIVARTPAHGEALHARLSDAGITSRTLAAQAACEDADIIVTATTSTAPLFDDQWVRPGTHVASMGSDAIGKHELPVELFDRARLFSDLPSQSLTIGEFQHAAPSITAGRLELTAIGLVLAGQVTGRRSGEEITVFDSSGLALQDLAVATALLDASTAHGD